MDKRPTAGIVLAAGTSSRLGRPKQLLPLGNTTLIGRVVAVAAASELDAVVVVLGHEAGAITSALLGISKNPKVRICFHPAYRDGMASSLQAGLRAVRGTGRSVMILLGDQPFITTEMVNGLLERFHAAPEGICVPCAGQRQGPPACFSERYYSALMALEGDIGARRVILSHPWDVRYVDIGSDVPFLDIDTAGDARRIRRMTADSAVIFHDLAGTRWPG